MIKDAQESIKITIPVCFLINVFKSNYLKVRPIYLVTCFSRLELNLDREKTFS